MQTTCKIIESLAHGYSSESTQQELSDEYQHDRVLMVFKKSLHPGAIEQSGSLGYRGRPVFLRGIQDMNEAKP